MLNSFHVSLSLIPAQSAIFTCVLATFIMHLSIHGLVQHCTKHISEGLTQCISASCNIISLFYLNCALTLRCCCCCCTLHACLYDAFYTVLYQVLGFIKTAVGMLATHYPARSNCIFIINVPTWFYYIFRMIKPMLSENTRHKIRPYDSNQVSLYNTLQYNT